MPKPTKKFEVMGRYFRWLIGQRGGVYFADGRSNNPSLGRQSLRTQDRDKALQAVQRLDLKMAVKCGRADRSLLKNETKPGLSWAEGRRLYEKHTERARVAGGPRPSTRKRYRAVLNKFIAYAEAEGYRTWNQVNPDLFDGYAGWLEDESYEYATQYLELTTLKQIVKFLCKNKHLPDTQVFPYPLDKPDGTDTYCWRKEEVAAMLAHCESAELTWLRHVIVGLVSTGLRISELAALRWSDVKLSQGMITITDESRRRKGSSRGAQRTTKSGRDRSFPIHESLRAVLMELPRIEGEPVFRGPRGGVIKADTVRRILIRDVLVPLSTRFPAQPEGRSFIDGRLHSFRHYFCSTCANDKVPVLTLMRWLGHRSSRMLERYYHLHDPESIQQMQRVKLY